MVLFVDKIYSTYYPVVFLYNWKIKLQFNRKSNKNKRKIAKTFIEMFA
jgi:hypothetical protein